MPSPSPPSREWVHIDYVALRENILQNEEKESGKEGGGFRSPHSAWREKYIRQLDSSELSGKTLRIICYNILAEVYATPERHNCCPSWALKWVF